MAQQIDGVVNPDPPPLFKKESPERHLSFLVDRVNPSRHSLWGLPVDCLSMAQTLSWITQTIEKRSPPRQHTVVNAAKIVLAQKDSFLKQSILESDLVNVDGQAVVWAARWLGIPVPEKVSGVDLMIALLQLAEQKKWRLFFLGAQRDVLETMLQRLRFQYSSFVIAGARDGYFSDQETPAIALEIQKAKPDILFVGMPTPRKENFIRQFKETMQVPFSMGVGGSFDILAGKTKRAPAWLQKMGLEWFFRFCQEPRRLGKRYFKTNTLFLYMVLRELLLNKRRT